MKSSKQKRIEIKRKRAEKARLAAEAAAEKQQKRIMAEAVLADPTKIEMGNSYSFPPEYYLDQPFTCQDCGREEVWTAAQQKWWYEEAKGNINSRAIRCRDCRNRVRDEKEAQRLHMEAIANKEPHPNEAFFKKKSD